jgi:hypothetical protein
VGPGLSRSHLNSAVELSCLSGAKSEGALSCRLLRGYLPPGETVSAANGASVWSEGRRCVHGFPVFGGRFTNCLACHKLGRIVK